MNRLPFLDVKQLLEDLDTLAQIGGDGSSAVNRVAYSAADQAGRVWVIEQMRALGMAVRTDEAGNTIAVYAGEDATLPPIALCSHTDTVPDGGRYDGSLGVLAALACIRALRDAKMRLRHPVEVINFAAEETTMSNGTTGSRAMVGLFDPAAFDKLAWDGRPVREHFQNAGLDPATVLQAKRQPGSLSAILELHIEQGENLVQAGIPIGIVEGMVGIRRYAVTFHGYANHAGTTPMKGRQDALVMAAPFILAVRDTAIAHEIVGTIGVLNVQPSAPNVIPGQVDLIVELRGLNDAILDQAEAHLAEQATQGSATFAPILKKSPVDSDPRLVAALAAACDDLNLPYLKMPSGAGHDAMSMASIAPQAMLFAPSQGGVSHSPDEYTTPQDCANGARVLLAGLLRLDEMLA